MYKNLVYNYYTTKLNYTNTEGKQHDKNCLNVH